MTIDKADRKPDFIAAEDRGERTTLMEPLVLGEGSRHRAALTDLALELAQRSAGFRRSLPASLLTSLATLVRAMNCYYTNLIEGHDTHPVDIERALQGEYSRDAKKRNLQLEAQAHIAVQQWIDEGCVQGRAITADAIREIHRRFCELLPDDLLWVENPDTYERMRVIPGELRQTDVRVGGHVAISAPALSRRAAARGRRRHRWHRGPPGPPRRLRPDPAWLAGLEEQPCAVAVGISGGARVTLDAGFVS